MKAPAIIIEGMDCSGKSTLARLMASQFDRQIQESEGPPRAGEDINDRINEYMRRDLSSLIFVRHPAISQPIYSGLANNVQTVEPDLLTWFYQLVRRGDYIIIYCDPAERGLDGHEIKEHDTPEHIAAVEEKYHSLVGAYRQWAGRNAHFNYRIGDNVDALLNAVRASIRFYARAA